MKKPGEITRSFYIIPREDAAEHAIDEDVCRFGFDVKWWSIGDSNPWPRQCECRALTKHAYIRPDAMIELTGFWDLIPFGDASRKALRRDKKVDDDVVMPVNGDPLNHPRQNHLLSVVAGGIEFFGPVVYLLNL